MGKRCAWFPLFGLKQTSNHFSSGFMSNFLSKIINFLEDERTMHSLPEPPRNLEKYFHTFDYFGKYLKFSWVIVAQILDHRSDVQISWKLSWEDKLVFFFGEIGMRFGCNNSIHCMELMDWFNTWIRSLTTMLKGKAFNQF